VGDGKWLYTGDKKCWHLPSQELNSVEETYHGVAKWGRKPLKSLAVGSSSPQVLDCYL